MSGERGIFHQDKHFSGKVNKSRLAGGRRSVSEGGLRCACAECFVSFRFFLLGTPVL